jgi:hypothetical protein
VVLGASFPLVHYGSEARGYAMAVAFGLAAMLVAVRDGVTPRSRAAPVAWALLVLAFLGHPLALHVLVALVVWGAVRIVARDGLARGLATIAWWFAVPLAAFALFYLTFLRGITVGGGNRLGIWPPLLRAVAMTTGLPFGAPALVLVAVALVAVGVGLAWLASRGSDEWILYGTGIVASPVLLAVVQPTNLYAERYFLVSATLLLLLTSRVLAWAPTQGGAAAGAAAAVLALHLAADLQRVGHLVSVGRGRYRDTLSHAVRRTSGDTVTIGSDHDFRNRLLVEYHGPRVAAGKTVRYVRMNETAATPPEWYLAHRMLGEKPPLPSLDRGGVRYALQREYDSAPLSGWRWFLYQRVS